MIFTRSTQDLPRWLATAVMGATLLLLVLSNTTKSPFNGHSNSFISPDQSGVVRVWNTALIQGTYYKLKAEKRALSGPISDLAWSPDGTKIVAVGQGRET